MIDQYQIDRIVQALENLASSSSTPPIQDYTWDINETLKQLKDEYTNKYEHDYGVELNNIVMSINNLSDNISKMIESNQEMVHKLTQDPLIQTKKQISKFNLE